MLIDRLISWTFPAPSILQASVHSLSLFHIIGGSRSTVVACQAAGQLDKWSILHLGHVSCKIHLISLACLAVQNHSLQQNELCFRPRFCICQAILGRGQPGLLGWILLWIMPLVHVTYNTVHLITVSLSILGHHCFSSGGLASGRTWSLMTDCPPTMAAWCSSTQPITMSSGPLCWRKRMPSEWKDCVHIEVIIPVYSYS